MDAPVINEEVNMLSLFKDGSPAKILDESNVEHQKLTGSALSAVVSIAQAVLNDKKGPSDRRAVLENRFNATQVDLLHELSISRRVNITSVSDKNTVFELKWWKKSLRASYNDIRSNEFNKEIFSDASLTGWRAVCNKQKSMVFGMLKKSRCI